MRVYVDVWFMGSDDEDRTPAALGERAVALRGLPGVIAADRTFDASDEYILVAEVADLGEFQVLVDAIEALPNLSVNRARVARPS
jgi:hypothetical protein